MARQCGCLGGNENCRMCFGLGYIEERRQDRNNQNKASSSPSTASSSNTAPTISKEGRGQHWSHMILETRPKGDPIRFQQQLARAQERAANPPREPIDPKYRRSAAPPPVRPIKLGKFKKLKSRPTRNESLLADVNKKDLAVCPKCGRKFSKNLLKWHIGLVHGGGRSQKSHKPAAPLIKSSLDLASQPVNVRGHIKCPHCVSFVKPAKIHGHIETVHGRKLPPSRRAIRAGSSTTADSMPSRSSPSLQRDDHLENRRLDASRDYWRYREGGRFGSHPSYDDCGDESKP